MPAPSKQMPAHLRAPDLLQELFGEYDTLENALLAHAELCKDENEKPLTWNDWRREIVCFSTVYDEMPSLSDQQAISALRVAVNLATFGEEWKKLVVLKAGPSVLEQVRASELFASQSGLLSAPSTDETAQGPSLELPAMPEFRNDDGNNFDSLGVGAIQEETMNGNGNGQPEGPAGFSALNDTTDGEALLHPSAVEIVENFDVDVSETNSVFQERMSQVNARLHLENVPPGQFC